METAISEAVEGTEVTGVEETLKASTTAGAEVEEDMAVSAEVPEEDTGAWVAMGTGWVTEGDTLPLLGAGVLVRVSLLLSLNLIFIIFLSCF